MKTLFLVIGFLLLVVSALAAATCYVSPTGSNTSPYDTWTKAALLPETAVTYLNGQVGPHVLYIAPGEYNSNIDLTDADWNDSLIVGTCAHGSLCDAAKGQVWITKDNYHQAGVWSAVSGVIIKNISFKNSNASYVQLVFEGSNNTAENCLFRDPGSVSVRTDGGSGNIVQHSAFEGGNNSSAGSFALYAQHPIRLIYCLFLASTTNSIGGTQAAIRLDHSSGNVYLDHVTLVDPLARGIYQHGAGTTYVRNSVIFGGSDDVILRDGGSITVSNTISVKPSGDVWVGTVTDGGGNSTVTSFEHVNGGIPGHSPAKDAGAVLFTYAAHPGDFIGAKVYGAAPDIGAYEYQDHTFGGWFFEMFIPTIFNLCASTNASCYTQP